MITRNDCLLLLSNLKDEGIDTSEVTKILLKQNEPTTEVLKFINENRPLEVRQFYEKIRHSYNNKSSKLYINIVKEIDNTEEVLTTLSAMLTQILLYSRTVEDKRMFLKHSRADEISFVLLNYFKTYDITSSIKLLRIIKADLKALESITKTD